MSRVPPRPDRDPHMDSFALLALGLGLVAFGLTLPFLPGAFKVLGSHGPASQADLAMAGIGVWAIAAPLGIVSLVLGLVARRRIYGSFGRLTGRAVATGAVTIACLGAISWVMPVCAGFSQSGY